ncbi:hypothetical protein CUMW_073010, partial [Citrus unshiu]
SGPTPILRNSLNFCGSVSRQLIGGTTVNGFIEVALCRAHLLIDSLKFEAAKSTAILTMSNSQAITCKAVVCWGLGEPLKVEEIQVEPPKSTEVRVKMLYASVCHTDILCSEGFPAPLYPRVLGHEGVGVVESAGDEVKEVKEGDIVIPTYIGECKECENCTSEMTNLCLKYPIALNGLMLDGTSRMSVRGQKLYHIFSCSTWSEYMVIDANYVVKVESKLILGCLASS